jgi:cytochrome c
MRLYHGTYIVPGLALFLALAAFPIWHGAIGKAQPAFESLPNPQGDRCIESKDYMRTHHMQLLIQWRDEVVRDGERVYTATDGTPWKKSLTQTCMNCHARADARGVSLTAATYCTDCHTHAGVSLYCWDCHVDPVATANAVTIAGRVVQHD